MCALKQKYAKTWSKRKETCIFGPFLKIFNLTLELSARQMLGMQHNQIYLRIAKNNFTARSLVFEKISTFVFFPCDQIYHIFALKLTYKIHGSKQNPQLCCGTKKKAELNRMRKRNKRIINNT